MEKVKKIIPAVVGVILIGVSVFLYFRAGELAKVCTEEATATVVNMREDFETTTEEGIRYIYYPVVQYQANGQTVTQELGSGSNSPAYNINDTVVILYNPDKVEEFIVKGENQSLVAIIMAAVGVVFLGVGIYVIVKK